MKFPLASLHRAACTRRHFLGLGTGAAAGLALPRLLSAAPAATPPLFPQLARVGGKFTIALIADTHFSSLDAPRGGASSNNEKFRRIAAEINSLQPAPAFVVHLGDVISNPQPVNVAAAKALLPELKPLTVLVHGNHDGHPPWTEFKEMQRAANGTDATRFSFDCGEWHFVVLPFDQGAGAAFADELVTWLEADLRAARGRPTMVFEHHHLLPQGLTQLESYTYDQRLRSRILETLAAAGNVRWVFCGHVHNGIQAAVKTAWTWRGINFLTAPTVVPPRNFGEEYPPFAAGQANARDNGGGYYLLVDVDGARVQVRGRLVDTAAEHHFADTFRPYRDEEPLWFRPLADLPPRPALENGSFEQALAAWTAPYRYLSDRDPGYSWKADPRRAKSGRNAAHLFVREKGQTWAKDEITELYQWVRLPAGAPVVRASYFVDEPDVGGGGYARFTAFAGREPKLTYLLDWGGGDRPANMRMALHAQFMAKGEKAGPAELIQLGRRKEALFWRLPAETGRWHDVHLQLAAAYDAAIGQAGGFAALQLDRLLIGIGVWCGDARGSRSGCRFDDVVLGTAGAGGAPVSCNGAPLAVDASVFNTDFGAAFLPTGGGKESKAGRKARKS